MSSKRTRNTSPASTAFTKIASGEWSCATPKPAGRRSRTGTHFVGAPMPYFLRFRDGYGMHAGFVPRYRASHGCIRMPIEMAKHFFDAAKSAPAWKWWSRASKRSRKPAADIVRSGACH